MYENNIFHTNLFKTALLNVKKFKRRLSSNGTVNCRFLASLSLFTNNTEVRLSQADMHRTPTLKTLQQFSRQEQTATAVTLKHVFNYRKQFRLYAIRQSK